jgi:hypothetical protein
MKTGLQPGNLPHTARATAGYRPITLVLAGMLLTACAAAPLPPTEALRGAEQAITNAEQARVMGYASAELTEAREKLAAARKAADAQEMVTAERLAEQARVDAELALAKAEAARAEAVNEEMMASSEILRQEMQRYHGDRE